MISKTVLYIAAFVLLIGCKEKIEGGDFDQKKWKSDKGGCAKVRKEIIKDLIKIKNGLKGRSSEEIVEFLGKPDKEDLYSRNQKFFYYYLAPGQHCTSSAEVSSAQKIEVRFNAMNRCTEVNYLREG